MASQLPKLLTFTIILLFPLFFSFSFSMAAITTTTKTAPYKLVNDFCNRKDISVEISFCLNLFMSDSRSATATNNLTLFEIAMKIGIYNLKKTQNYFTAFGNSKPSLKPTLDYCSGFYYDDVIGTLQIYYRDVVTSGGKVADTKLVSYDFGLAEMDITNCGNSFKSAGIHDKSLWARNGEAMDYFLVCYGITKVVTNTTD